MYIDGSYINFLRNKFFPKKKSIDDRRRDYISWVLSKRHNPEDEEQIIKEATEKFYKENSVV